MKTLIEKTLLQSYTYADYRELVAQLVEEGKTTGPNQSEFYVDITKLNQSRMDRLDKKARFSSEMENMLAGLTRPYTFLVLTEAWCGDAAQTTPLLNHMATATDQINLRFALRDDNPELMDHFLTDGGRSIPKVIILAPETNEVLDSWGPRPAPAQEMAMAHKYQPEPKPDYNTFNVALHKWYAKDKTQTSQEELMALLEEIEGR
ncbi:MAG: thioredoxin family protein [Bacteroidota bacterium]